MAELIELQKTIGITFRDLSLLEQALVHRSYLHENPDFPLPSNERLEFLGDALLGFVVAEILFQQFPTSSEGEMTRLRAALVQQESLAQLASSLKLGEYLYLGKGEEKSGGRQRQKTLAGALEAVMGAIFLERGFAAAKSFVSRLLNDSLQELREGGLIIDYKSKLQELVQAKRKGTPEYYLMEAAGPDHDKSFRVKVVVDHEVLGQGMGKNKRMAEKEAAREALEKLSTL